MVGPVLQLGVKAQFYLASKGKYTFEACEWAKPKETKRREEKQEAQFWLLFHLRFSLRRSDLPLFYFHGLFLLFVF